MSFSGIVTAISADLNAAIAAASGTPLVGGGILLGREFEATELAPPMIWVRQTTGAYGPRDNAYTAQGPVASAVKALRTVKRAAVVTIWAAGGSRVADYDYVEALENQFWVSVNNMLPGLYTMASGKWMDDTVWDRMGIAYQFGFSVDIPITDTAFAFAPPDVHPAFSTKMQFIDGSQGTACAG